MTFLQQESPCYLSLTKVVEESGRDFYKKRVISFIRAGVDRKSKVFIFKGLILSENLEANQFAENLVRNGNIKGLEKELCI